MPPSKQKHLPTNRDAPGRTLHDFFSAKLVSTQFQGQPQNIGSSKSRRRTTSTKTSPEQEVIVIDSDSDDAYETVEGTSFHKRRKLSPKNSNDLVGSKVDAVSIDDDKSTDISIPYIQRIEGRHCQRQTISFGRPSLLCSSPEDDLDGYKVKHDNVLPLETASNTPQTFGLAGSLGCSKVDIDFTLDDWDNGDDEVVNSIANDVLDQDVLQNVVERKWEPDFPSYQDEDQTYPVEKETTFCLHQAVVSGSSEKVNHTQESSHIKNKNDAFSLLMTSVKEKEAWKEADATGDKIRRTNAYARRKAPFYKVLQGMPIAVDAFCYGAIPGVNAYFLSHAHSDHYTNLSSSWKNGPVYCSKGTANLIIYMLNVDKKWVRPLPMDTPTLIPDTSGVTVTLIEANHCPGSCLFFFEGPQTVNAGDSNFRSPFVGSSRIFRYLHCGDFRASPQHIQHPALRGNTVDHVYLDTTYLDPRYTFPPQPLVISACAELARKVVCGEQLNEEASGMCSWLSKGKEKDRAKPLILVGTYSIGKERLVKAIAHAVNSKIYCDTRKASILRCLADPELDALLTSDPKDSIVHLVPLATITTDRLKFYLGRLQGAYDRVIGFRPTGWTFTQAPGVDPSPSITTILTKTTEQKFSHLDLRLSPKSTTMIQVYPVPYSEHSSFNELTCFAMSFSWVKIIATVNVGSEPSRAKMAKWFAKWEAERKKRVTNTIVPYRDPHYW